MKSNRGFTLVELVVVIAVIGILSTITVLGYTRYQANSRDTIRLAKATVITEALEKYYDLHGEYPGCQALTQSPATVSALTLKGVDLDAYTTPLAAKGVNTITCGTITANGPDVFGYQGDGSATCNSQTTNGSCLGFVFQYKDEVDGTIATINSRRSANINTSGAIADLSATPDGTNGFTTIDLSWTSIANAASYTVQYSTDNFNTSINTVSPSPTTNSAVIGSLTNGQAYQFRVQPVSSGGTIGGWSNIVTATTWSITPPTLTAGATGPNSLAFSWNSPARATSYSYQVATDAAFSNVVTAASTSSTNGSANGLTTGVTYYIHVDATALGGTIHSGYSSPLTMVTAVPAPTGLTATTNSSTQITASWNSVPVATSYKVEYSLSSNFSATVYATTTSAPTTTVAIASLSQGQPWYFRVYAITNSISSVASSVASATTSIDAPASYTISSSWDGTYLNATSNAVCPAGTTTNYYWYVNGGAWVTGSSYRSVGYAVPYNQPITLTVNSLCYTAAATSGWVGASNSAYYNNPALVILGIQKVTGGSSNGHRVWFWWSNLCGGSNQIIGYQGGYNTGWISPNWSSTGNPAVGGVPTPSSTNDTRNWYSGGSVTDYARQDCGGWQQSVNSATIYA